MSKDVQGFEALQTVDLGVHSLPVTQSETDRTRIVLDGTVDLERLDNTLIVVVKNQMLLGRHLGLQKYEKALQM